MTNEGRPHNIRNPQDDLHKEGDNTYRGEFRTSLLDLDLLLHSLSVDRVPEVNRVLVVTCVDQIRDDLRLTHGGEIKMFKDTVKFLSYIEDAAGIRVLYTDSPDTESGLKQVTPQ